MKLFFGARTLRITIALVIAIGLVYLKRRTEIAHEPVPTPAPETQNVSARVGTPLPTVTSQASPLASPHAAPTLSSAIPFAEAWQSFQKQYGSELKPELRADGYLASIRGTPDRNAPASSEYRSDEAQKAIQRAKEVLESARDLLGVEGHSPLENPIARTSQASAQVEFQQTWDGLPIIPQGSVSVNLGPHGEILGIDSSYLKGLRVTNEARLSSDSLKPNALAAAVQASGVSIEGSASRVEGGAHVIWIVQMGDPPEGRHAFQYFVQRRQVVLDAANAAILSNREQSHH